MAQPCKAVPSAHFVRMFVGCEPGAQVQSYAHHLVILALVSPLPVAKSIHYHGSTYNSALPVVRLVVCWNAQVVWSHECSGNFF